MATAYKRKRIKTGPHSWLNVTQHRNGTTSTSSSTSVAGRTTNISSKGVRRTVNDKGWVTTTRIPAFPKPKKTKKYRSKTPRYKKSSFSLWSFVFGSNKKSIKKSAAKRANDSVLYSEEESRKDEAAKAIIDEQKRLEDEQRKEQLRIENEKRLEEKRLREIEKAERDKFKSEFIGPPKPVTLDVKIIAYSIIAAFIYCAYKVFQFIFWLIYSI